MQCTGYLKSWAPAKSSTDQENENEGTFDGEACNLSCLVAVGRVQPELLALSPGITIPRLRTIEFVSRHAIDGKFIFVDQRFILLLNNIFPNKSQIITVITIIQVQLISVYIEYINLFLFDMSLFFYFFFYFYD